MTDDFETWYRAEYARMVNTLALVTGDRSLATDAACEACIKALARWKKVGQMDRPGGWVYRVALNEARRRAKRVAREQQLLSATSSARNGVLECAEPPAHGDLDLWDAVGRLGERTKTAVVLRYVADLTEPEIARVMGVTRGTVATMLRRAHERLATELGPTAVPNAQEYSNAHVR